MKKLIITSIFGLALAVALGFGFIPQAEQTASCATCDSRSLSDISKIFRTYYGECEKRIDGALQPRKCLQRNIYELILSVMKALGKDNRFGPGDRILLVGQPQNGNLIAGANRTFHSLVPLDKDSVTVTVNKTDGKNGAIVRICTADDKGKMTHIETINFAEDGNEKETKSATVTGVEGKVVVVDISSFGNAVRKFTYTLRTS